MMFDLSLINILIFLAVLSLMVFVHELGHFITAKRAGVKVEEFGVGFPPRLVAWRRGETEYSINLIPLGGFTKMLGEEDPSESRSFARAKKRSRAVILVAGSAMNVLLAILLFAIAFMTGAPSTDQVQVSQVASSSPAAVAGLQPNDVVVSLAGTEITGSTQLRTETEKHLDETVPMVIDRGGQEMTLNVTPRADHPSDQGPLGVTIGYKMVRYDPLTALAKGAEYTWQVIYLTVSLPIMLLRQAIPMEMARVSGPIGIFQVTSQAAEVTIQTGLLWPILNIMGVFSAGLGLANMLPIPGLDGGRLLFIAIEAIRGKRISPEKEGIAHLAGFLLLISVMLVVSYFDILYPITQMGGTP